MKLSDISEKNRVISSHCQLENYAYFDWMQKFLEKCIYVKKKMLNLPWQQKYATAKTTDATNFILTTFELRSIDSTAHLKLNICLKKSRWLLTAPHHNHRRCKSIRMCFVPNIFWFEWEKGHSAYYKCISTIDHKGFALSGLSHNRRLNNRISVMMLKPD